MGKQMTEMLKGTLEGRDCDVCGRYRPVRTERGEWDPIREIVGKDPVEFIETFVRTYPMGQWIIRERERLTHAIDRAVGEERAV